MFLSPLRIVFLVAGVSLGYWVAGVQHDFACRDAGGRVGAEATGGDGKLCYGLGQP